MRTAAKLLWLMVLTPPLLVGLSIGFILLELDRSEKMNSMMIER